MNIENFASILISFPNGDKFSLVKAHDFWIDNRTYRDRVCTVHKEGSSYRIVWYGANGEPVNYSLEITKNSYKILFDPISSALPTPSFVGLSDRTYAIKVAEGKGNANYKHNVGAGGGSGLPGSGVTSGSGIGSSTGSGIGTGTGGSGTGVPLANVLNFLIMFE